MEHTVAIGSSCKPFHFLRITGKWALDLCKVIHGGNSWGIKGQQRRSMNWAQHLKAHLGCPPAPYFPAFFWYLPWSVSTGSFFWSGDLPRDLWPRKLELLGSSGRSRVLFKVGGVGVSRRLSSLSASLLLSLRKGHTMTALTTGL